MKLLYISNGINGSGGLERVLSVKASYLTDKMNYEIHILVLNDAHINPFYEFSPKIKFHSVKVSGNPIKYFFNYRKGIKSIIREVQPDVISVCDDGLKGLLFPLIFGKSTPVIYERHVSKKIEQKKDKLSILDMIKLKLRYSLMDLGAKKFDKFIVLTKGNKSEWKFNNVEVIPNPLPFYPHEKALLKNKKILAVGKQSYQKGYDRLIRMWGGISELYPGWNIEVYGKKDNSLGLDQMLIDYQVDKSIKFYHPQKNIQEKYKHSSIYVMTSRFEGFGMVLIEAMAYGIPCVSFSCPHGPADIITDGVDGFLVSNGDIDDFKQKIGLLIENADLREKMGAAARKNVKRFTIENIAGKWNNLFNRIENK